MDHLLSLTDLLARNFPGLAAHPAFTQKHAHLDSDGEDDEDEEEEEDNNAPKKKKRKKRKCRNDEATAKRSETPAAERKAGDLRDCEESPSKAKDKGEFVGGGPPPKTMAKGGEFLSQLSRVASKEGQEALESFILELVEFHTAPTQNTIPSGSRTEDIIHTLECPGEIAKNGEKLIKKGHVLDFHMLVIFARFRFAMHNGGMTHQVPAEKMGFKEEKSSRNYMQQGQRVLDLAGGALELKDRVTGIHLTSADFRNCGRNGSARLQVYKLDFKEIAYNDTLLSRLKTNSPPLRPRATKIWDKIFNPPVFPLPPVAPKVYPTECIQTSICIPRGTCPVPKDLTAAKRWVEREREVAENRIQVASCDELKEKAGNLLDLLSVFLLLISLQLESIHSNIEENHDTYGANIGALVISATNPQPNGTRCVLVRSACMGSILGKAIFLIPVLSPMIS
ncbi:hypothetical protein C8F04DRAFT_1187959 [Mycena alexandri]|uniref:Uncharacterized protein n=1 Tax=Mycena alexandri TaxID=1745969 RepID=A0AAD6SLZ5_9AGAR|nr:hypothetical protein C8F04DRAFT_1187959 [Mycena alexandri]